MNKWNIFSRTLRSVFAAAQLRQPSTCGLEQLKGLLPGMQFQTTYLGVSAYLLRL